ncbi:50S ribosomal protein L6 [Fervidicoccus fontis]|uniref:Large ribosomal subunit protein uL6 n=1 Tax=Fervidicoccus fontis TaxID=683846 RepID=A0A2J6N336_9CREN|nr:50S ribosomal protein L6 [Fervidicoccus fontis]MBE9391107.1 50S ribosomal protein L6 [Fervidicoccus fontis]PMB75719.1 MAG: 50S ribosomal protein L6 [Fervidicoccus fontis]PMB78105.1 MAG: 50S ribosomal protein L6 [Fervidicoccus fontis]HEW64171.1 50S ribosomal protein L6 [Fervidicoccus fontis]
MVKSVHVVEEVEIPEGVKISIEGMKVVVEGPKGKIEKDFSHTRNVAISLSDGKVVVESYFARREQKALVGTIAAHIRNMITGVQKGYRYKLKIISSHFPISLEQKGDVILVKNFLGEKSPRKARIMPGVKVKIEKEDVIVEGLDIEAVGQTAANLEQATKVKEYDRRVFMDGIYIYEKGEAK